METKPASSAVALFGKLLLDVLILFALSVPLFYLDAALTLAGHGIPFLYIALRAVRLAAAAGIGFRLRGRALRVPENVRRYILLGSALCAALLVWGADGIRAFYAAGWSFGLLYPADGPLLPSAVWEQFMNGDLLWALTLCTAAAFFRLSLPEKARRAER